MSPEAKEEGSLTQTVIELVVKFVPTLINIISGETGPSQTDRIEGIDLNVMLDMGSDDSRRMMVDLEINWGASFKIEREI